jgi:hypothetical protein
MHPDQLKQLRDLLLIWAGEDFGDLPRFVLGEWSRRSLEGLIEDVHTARMRAKALELAQRLKARYVCRPVPSDT